MSFSVHRLNSAMVVGLVKRRNANLRNAKPRNSQLIKAMFGTVMPRNTKLRNANRKMQVLEWKAFLALSCTGLLFEFLASFSRCLVVPWRSPVCHKNPEGPSCTAFGTFSVNVVLEPFCRRLQASALRFTTAFR